MNPTPNAPTQTATQAGAAEEKMQFIQAEKVEAEEEFREKIIKKLDEILEKIDMIECGSGAGILPIPGGPRIPGGPGGRRGGNRGGGKGGKGGKDAGKGGKPPKPSKPDGGGKTPKPGVPDGGGKGVGKVLGGVGRLAGKIAAPLAIGIAAYDAYQGFNADPNASLGDKLSNAGSSALSGFTFGLLGSDADEIAAEAAAKPQEQPQPDQGPKLPPGMDPESPEAEKFFEDYYNPPAAEQNKQLQLQSPELDEFDKMQKSGEISPAASGLVPAEQSPYGTPYTSPQQRLNNVQTNLDQSVQENLTQTQMPMAPTVINNTTQVPIPTPQSSGGSGMNAIQVRNTEPSVATYIASIFDHPVTHPGIYKM